MNYLSIGDKDRVLIVAPHPDDECIGVGGLLALYPKKCHVLVLTDGRIGQSNYSPKETIRIRKQELINELDSIDVGYSFFDIEDGMLSKDMHILDEFDLSKYSKIFVSGKNDGHPDHSAAYHIVKNAIIKQRIALELYLYEVHTPLEVPTHMLDVSSVIDLKIGLIQYHKSQLDIVSYDKMARALAEFRAIQNRMNNSYLEVFQLDIDNTCTVMNRFEVEIQKQRMFYRVLTKWIEALHNGWNLGKELKARGYMCVGVYGDAELGRLAAREIDYEDGIELKCIFDKKTSSNNKNVSECCLLYPNRYYSKIDCIVVTAIYYYEEIKNELMNLGYETVLSLKEIVEDAK